MCCAWKGFEERPPKTMSGIVLMYLCLKVKGIRFREPHRDFGNFGLAVGLNHVSRTVTDGPEELQLKASISRLIATRSSIYRPRKPANVWNEGSLQARSHCGRRPSTHNAAHAQHACIELIRILLTGANGIVERFKDQLVVSTRVRALSHGITSTFGSSHAQDLSPSSKFTLNPEQGACAKKRHAQCFHDQRTQSIAVPCRLQVEPLELLSRNRCHAL